MSEAEIYYREVNCLTIEEHPILDKKHYEVIELMEEFNNHQNQAKHNEDLGDVSESFNYDAVKFSPMDEHGQIEVEALASNYSYPLIPRDEIPELIEWLKLQYHSR